jgi:5S rRNA maturation endonuclease (ribonuclease M5)
LSTHKKDRLEKIQQVIAKLAEEAAKGKPVLVEGKKDAQALADLGVSGNVLTLKTGGKSFLQTITEIEESGAREVILFLDFDRRGDEATAHLKRELERLRIKANVRLSCELKALVNRDVQSIESLPAYLVTLQQKAASKC